MCHSTPLCCVTMSNAANEAPFPIENGNSNASRYHNKHILWKYMNHCQLKLHLSHFTLVMLLTTKDARKNCTKFNYTHDTIVNFFAFMKLNIEHFTLQDISFSISDYW